MAVNSAGIGITISIRGNFDGRLRSLERGLNTATNANKNLEKSFERTRKAALNQAIAFGVLTIHLRKVASMGAAVFKSTAGAFAGMIKGAADFQQSALTLKVFFGDKSETLVGNLQALSATSGVAVDDLVTITSRLGQAGMSANMAARATNLVSQAFQTLPAAERTKALNSMGLAFKETNSFNKAFNVTLNDTEQAAFNASSGTKRMEIGMQALEKRFGNVNAIMEGSFNKQLSILSALFKTLNNLIVLPALGPLTKALRAVNIRFNEMFTLGGKNERTIKALQDIVKSFLSPLTGLIQTVGKLNLIPKALEFLANHPELVKAAGAIVLLGSAFASLAGSLGIAAFALLSFRGVWQTTELGGALGTVGKSIKSTLFSPALLKKSLGGFSMASIGKSFGGGISATISGIPTMVSSLGTLLANLGLVTFAVITLGIVFKEIFSGLKGPSMDFFGGVIDLAKGLFEVFTEGRVHTSILKNIEAQGLRPIFNIILTMGTRIMAFFKGMSDGVSGLGQVFSYVFVGLLGTAFSEILNSIQELLINFGLMDKGGKQGAYTIGVVFGKAFKFLGSVIQWVAMGVIPTLVFGLKFVIGLIEAFVGTIQLLLAAVFKLAEFGVYLAGIARIKEIGGVRTEDVKARLAGSSKDFYIKAGMNADSFVRNVTLQSSPTTVVNSQTVIAQGEINRAVKASVTDTSSKKNETDGNS